ncbi:hypothetical protein CBM2591_U10030 [Cupriavidus taiwanensis]|nr:hypothetical protein CBM2591_U10030 [Cupriavidus taiwanensis]
MARRAGCGRPCRDGLSGSFLAPSLRCIGAGLDEGLVALDVIRDRIALDLEPPAAALGVDPLLAMRAAGIGAHEQVVSPFAVGQLVGFERARDVSLAAT